MFPDINDPAILEALACREALALAADLGIQTPMIILDCKGVVDDIQRGTGGYYENITREILLSSNRFASCFFVHQKRV